MLSRPDPSMETLGESLATRTVAFGIDAAVVGVVWAAVWLAGTAVRGGVDGGLSLVQGHVGVAGAAVWLVTWLVAAGFAAAYFVVSHAITGQSPGKRLVDVVVVTRDGGPCDWRAAGVRTAVLLAPAPLVAGLDLLAGVPGAALGAALVAAWLVVEALALVTDDEHRRLGDRLADTVVVEESLSSV